MCCFLKTWGHNSIKVVCGDPRIHFATRDRTDLASLGTPHVKVGLIDHEPFLGNECEMINPHKIPTRDGVAYVWDLVDFPSDDTIPPHFTVAFYYHEDPDKLPLSYFKTYLTPIFIITLFINYQNYTLRVMVILILLEKKIILNVPRECFCAFVGIFLVSD